MTGTGRDRHFFNLSKERWRRGAGKRFRDTDQTLQTPVSEDFTLGVTEEERLSVCLCVSHVCVLVYCFVIGGEHQCIWPQPKERGDKSDVPAEVAYVFNLNINVTFCDYLSIKTGSTDVFPNSG